MTTEFIYGLKCPIADTVMYVGRSVQPYTRLEQHMATAGHDSSRRSQWLYEIKQQGLRPTLVILEECDPSVVQEREVHWINVHKVENPELKNTVLSYLDDEDQRRITLRLPPDLHELILASAQARHLSVNAFIIMALESKPSSSTEIRFAEMDSRLKALEAKLH